MRPGPEHIAGPPSRPAIEAPRPAHRPTPPLPPDPIDDVTRLPRRDPGEAMARSRPPRTSSPRPTDQVRTDQVRTDQVRHRTDPVRTDPVRTDPVRTDPVRTDPGRTRTGDDWAEGAPAEMFRGRAAGGDGAAQPGRAVEHTSNGHAGNGPPAGEDGWSSWWTRSTPPDPGAPRPEPGRPEPRSEPSEPNRSSPAPLPEPRPPADDEGTSPLRRRVPQANLAAGLRRDAGTQPEPDDAPVVRDPMAARNALSRFQAAQRAARDAVDGDLADGGPR